MRALRKTASGPGQIEISEVSVPSPAPGEVLIRVRYAGVCGTDVHIYHDRFGSSPPVTLGHEFSGTIASVGEGVGGFSPGDRVVSANNPRACGVCRLCSIGLPNLCAQKRAMGIHSDGAFADFVVLEADLVQRVPDAVGLEEAALTEPLAVATHAVQARTRIEPGDTVLVFGPGAIGLLSAQVARAEGATKVVVVGTSADEETRLSLARELGFETVNAEAEDVVEWLMARTAGSGADVAVEAAGAVGAISAAAQCLRPSGRMAAFGITGSDAVRVPWDAMVCRAITVSFSYSSTNEDWRRSLQYLAQGSVTTRPLITQRLGLHEWREAFSALEQLAAVRPVFEIDDAKEGTR
jgi:L-iditol 2-dehydrogenase